MKLILAVLFAGCFWSNAKSQLYVSYFNAGIVSKYDADTGALISEHFLLGLKGPRTLCLANGALYVVQSGDGTIGKYDAETGATINDRFVSGLNMPQALAVSGGALYVASFDWPSAGGGRTASLIGKYDAVTGAAINYSLVKTDSLAASLAVSGTKLFVALADQPFGGFTEYDATSGAVITNHFAQRISPPLALALTDNWLWIMNGPHGTAGAIFKFDTETGASFLTRYFFPLPFIQNLNDPWVLAVSGNNIYVGGGGGTAVDKYSATTGELIKSGLVPSLSDHFGGIAVEPTAATPEVSWKETEFSAKNTFLNFVFWMSINGDYLYLASGVLVAIVVLGLCAMFFRRTPQQLEPAVIEPMPEPSAPEPTVTETSGLLAEEEPAPVDMPQAQTKPKSLLPGIMLGLFGVTLVLAAFLLWLASQATDLSHPGQRDTSDLIGIWGINNDGFRHADEVPILLMLQVYSSRLEFSTGHGSELKQGQWRDDGFWCQNSDSSDEIEVAKIISPEEMELHMSAFDPHDPTISVLYKEQGSDAEMQALAAKYPPPITYPPPTGVIKFWMSEYELKNLPWKPDSISPTGDEPYSRGTLYIYHSDDPHLDKLEVTVKNHRVVELKGGNG